MAKQGKSIDSMNPVENIAFRLGEKKKQLDLATESANQRVAAKWLKDMAGDSYRTQGMLGQANFVTRAVGRAEARRAANKRRGSK